MTNIHLVKVSSRLLTLAALATCLWFFSGSAASPQKTTEPRSLKVDVRQLDPDAGRFIELSCEDAKVSGTGRIEELSCVIRNNAFAAVIAATIKTSIVLEEDGQENLISGYQTFDTFFHPDFRADHKNNAIQPGMVYRFYQPPADFRDALVKQIQAEIDYVEFTDEAALGPNHAGARIISNIRQGAAKYRNWLVAWRF